LGKEGEDQFDLHMCVFTSSRDPSTVNKSSHTRKSKEKTHMSMQEKSPKKSRCEKGDWLTCTFPHWIPESTEKVTQVVDVFLQKSTPNQRRGGERFQVERERRGESLTRF